MSPVSLTPQHLQRQIQASNEQGPLVIDVRGRRHFSRARIAGSQNIPAGLLLSGEHPDRDLILIGSRDGEAEAIADQLHASGFHRRIQHLAGGLEAWREAGLALESSGPRHSAGQDTTNHGLSWLQNLTVALAIR